MPLLLKHLKHLPVIHISMVLSEIITSNNILLIPKKNPLKKGANMRLIDM